MNTNTATALARPHCYQLLHHAKSKRNVHACLDQYEARRKAQKKSGVTLPVVKGPVKVTEVTKGLVNVIVSKVLPATMEDLADNQPEEFQRCLTRNEFYIYTTIPSLITLLSGGNKHLKRDKKTIYNHIQLLLRIGVFTAKVNHMATGWKNPWPHEARKGGRGKIKLVFRAGLIHIREGQMAPSDSTPNPYFFAHKLETFPQYELLRSSISIENTIGHNNKDYNSPSSVDKALPIGKISYLNMENREQGSKPLPQKVPTISPEKLTVAAIAHRWQQDQVQSKTEKIARLLRQLFYQELCCGEF